MLKSLTVGGGHQIFIGAFNDPGRKGPGNFQLAAVEKLEKPQRMLTLLIGGFLENIGDLVKALLIGMAGKIGVTIAGLGLTGKRGEQVFGRLALSEFSHKKPP